MRKLTMQSENANKIVEVMLKYNFYATDMDIEGESNIFELMGFTCTYADISFIFQNEGGGVTDTVIIPNDLYDGSLKSELIDVFLGTLRENSLIPTPRIEEAPIEKYLFPFRSFVLGSSIEKFRMPHNLMGRVLNKSTWARRGVDASMTTNIEPGWVGFLTIELSYRGIRPIYIPAGSGICQIIFEEIKEHRAYKGKYQNQPDKPVEAK